MNRGLNREGERRRLVPVALVALALLLAPASAIAATTPLAEIGTPGTGAGQLAGVAGVAVDDRGDLDVVENANNRVSVFGPTGAFIHAFGYDVIPGGGTGFEVCTTATGCKPGIGPGSGPGQLYGPLYASVDGAGDLYVADYYDARISVYNHSGGFLRAFGYDVRTGPGVGFEVCTTATGCQLGSAYSGPGSFDEPSSTAVGADGNLYVAEDNNARVSVFDPTPTFLRAFGSDVRPGGGTGVETCTTATGCKAGVTGTGAGELNPRGIAVDDSGRVYVTEYANHRVSVFTSGGAFVHAFGYDVVPGGGTGFEVCTATTGCKAGVPGTAAGQLRYPEGAAVDPSGNLYIGDGFNGRVSAYAPDGSFLRSFGTDVIPGGGTGFEVCTTATGCQAGVNSGPGHMTIPGGVAVDCRGAIWVADTGSSTVKRYGEPGTLVCPKPRCAGREATIEGTSGSETLIGTAGRDVIAALGGNDRVRGLKGNDLVCGGAGRDRLIGGPGRDRLIGQAGSDRLLGQAGRDILKGGTGRDVLKGGPGRDRLLGGPGRDRETQ
jgi:Ca2+-binding RTX toxin-like protein